MTGFFSIAHVIICARIVLSVVQEVFFGFFALKHKKERKNYNKSRSRNADNFKRAH